MEKTHLVFVFQLSPAQCSLLNASRLVLKKYREQLLSPDLSLSDVTIQKLNYALIMLALICDSHSSGSDTVQVKDLLSISEALSVVAKSITFHRTITSITLYCIIRDQIKLINSIIADNLEAL